MDDRKHQRKIMKDLEGKAQFLLFSQFRSYLNENERTNKSIIFDLIKSTNRWPKPVILQIWTREKLLISIARNPDECGRNLPFPRVLLLKKEEDREARKNRTHKTFRLVRFCFGAMYTANRLNLLTVISIEIRTNGQRIYQVRKIPRVTRKQTNR